MANRLIVLGDERNDPRALSFANWILGWVNIIVGAPEAALVYSDQCLRMAIAPFDRLQGAVIKAVACIFFSSSVNAATRARSCTTSTGSLLPARSRPIRAALNAMRSNTVQSSAGSPTERPIMSLNVLSVKLGRNITRVNAVQ